MQNMSTAHRGLLGSSLRDAALYSNCQQLKNSLAEWHKPTAEHSIRVRIQATNLGLALGLTGKELTNLSLGAELHDIGKLRVPKYILDKQNLTDESEIECLRNHPAWGVEIISSVLAHNPDILACILQHHEREDGSGYPNKLTSSRIHPLAKIIAVADAFVTMKEHSNIVKHRSGQALMHLLNEDRSKFDQRVVKTLAKITMSTAIS